MRTTLLGALVVTTLIVLPGCDSGSDSSGDSSTRYSVRYEASGTFTQPCNIIYIARKVTVAADQENEGGQGFNIPKPLPWSYEFDVTVTQLRPFNLYVAAVCGGGTASSVADVKMYVNGDLVDSAQDMGSVVNPEAEFTLTLSN